MQIIKTTMILAFLAVIASIGVQQTAKATSDVFKVKVLLTDVDSATGELDVQVTGEDDTTITKTVNPFEEGRADNVQLEDFVFPASSTREGESFEVCVYSNEDDDIYTCKNGMNTSHKGPEVIYIQVPSGIGRTAEDTYYDNDGDIIKDSANTEKNQASGIDVSFGDNSHHNTVNIDQRSTFADVIRDLVPIAKEGAHMAKDTAVQLLN